MSAESIIPFPCEFPIKAMGRASDDLPQQLYQVVSRHDERLTLEKIKVQASRQGNYISVTIRVWAIDQAHLDRIYRDITACEAVLYTL